MKKSNNIDSNLYERYLAQINREDTLINSRLSWFLTSQGLFITALSIGSNIPSRIEYAIIVLGILISVITLVAGIMAKISLMNLYNCWRGKNSSIEPPLFGIQRGGKSLILNFLGAPVSFPIFFIIFWIIFLKLVN